MVDYTPMAVLLSVYCPLGLVVLGMTFLLTFHRRMSQRQRMATELVQQMLQRDMTADDIQCVLRAWHADPGLASKFKSELPPLKKFAG